MRRFDGPREDEPRPRRGRFLLRLAIGGLLGAAAFLGVGELIAVTGAA